MIKKGCEVSYIFHKGFILNIDHIQTISSIVNERYSNEELIYRITRTDSYRYQTSDINEVINEENSNANKIKKLSFSIDDGDRINFDLCFEKGESTVLKISGEDKDKIYLLYNDIKTYVDKEITVVRIPATQSTLRNICLAISSIVLLGVFFFFGFLLTSDQMTNGYEEVVNSSSELVKLNYLISQRVGDALLFDKYKYVLFAIMTASVLIVFLPSLVNFILKKDILVLTDYFLIGKQVAIYEKKKSVRNKIFWTVVVGSLVSIVTGVFVYFMTK